MVFIIAAIITTVKIISGCSSTYATYRIVHRCRTRQVDPTLINEIPPESRGYVNMLNDFRRLELKQELPVNNNNHSHHEAKYVRDRAGDYGKVLAAALGASLHHINIHHAQQFLGEKGSTDFKDWSDVKASYQEDSTPDNVLYMSTDRDSRMDMNSRLLNYISPHLLFTPDPKFAAGSGELNSSFWFKDNYLHTIVGGSSEPYIEKLWDYGVHRIVISGWTKPRRRELTSYLSDYTEWWKTRRTVVVYELEKRDHPLDINRSLVFLVPIFKYSHSWYNALEWFRNSYSHMPQILDQYPIQPLRRLQPNTINGKLSEFSLLKVHRSDGSFYVSIGSGDGCAASVSSDSWSAIRAVAMKNTINKLKLENQTVEAVLVAHDGSSLPISKRKAWSTNICNFFNGALSVDEGGSRVHSTPSTHVYQFYPEHYDYEDSRPALHSYMHCIIGPAAVPDGSTSNTIHAIHNRSLIPQNQVGQKRIMLNKHSVKTLEEFLDWFVGTESGFLCPVDNEYVAEHQPRAIQLKKNSRGQFMRSLYIKMTCKNESHGKITARRLIQETSDKTRLETASVAYAFSNWVKSQPRFKYLWGPGMTPARQCRAVAKAMDGCFMGLNADFTRMDGHDSPLLKFVFMSVLLRCFAPAYHGMIKRSLETSFGINAWYSSFTHHLQLNFNPQFTQSSGGGHTTTANTTKNGFVVFSAVKLDHPDWTGAEVGKHLEEHCVINGDDAVVGDLSARSHKLASQRLGHVSKAVEVISTEPQPAVGERLCIKFCGREFLHPEVFKGCYNSCVDIHRALTKLHLCRSRGNTVKPVQYLYEKLVSFKVTDPNTPIISELIDCFFKLVTPAEMKKLGASTNPNWYAQFTVEQGYENTVNSQFFELIEQDIPGFDWVAFREYLADCKCIDDMVTGMRCFVSEPKLPVVEHDATINADEKKGIKATSTREDAINDIEDGNLKLIQKNEMGQFGTDLKHEQEKCMLLKQPIVVCAMAGCGKSTFRSASNNILKTWDSESAYSRIKPKLPKCDNKDKKSREVQRALRNGLMVDEIVKEVESKKYHIILTHLHPSNFTKRLKNTKIYLVQPTVEQMETYTWEKRKTNTRNPKKVCLERAKLYPHKWKPKSTFHNFKLLLLSLYPATAMRVYPNPVKTTKVRPLENLLPPPSERRIQPPSPVKYDGDYSEVAEIPATSADGSERKVQIEEPEVDSKEEKKQPKKTKKWVRKTKVINTPSETSIEDDMRKSNYAGFIPKQSSKIEKKNNKPLHFPPGSSRAKYDADCETTTPAIVTKALGKRAARKMR